LTYLNFNNLYNNYQKLKWLPVLSNIAPPKLRREHALVQEWKQLANNPTLPILEDLNTLDNTQRLKSRKPHVQ